MRSRGEYARTRGGRWPMAKRKFPDMREHAEMSGSIFTARIAFAVLVFAILLAVSSLGENNAANEMLRIQQQAADQRASYQSKVIGENLYKTNGLRMEADLLERGPAMRPNVRKLYDAMLREMKTEEIRFREEKKKAETEAVDLEARRERSRAKGPYFDYAQVLLLISIMMAAISILSSSLQVFYFSIGSAALGALFMLNGLLLIFKFPFFR
jgi:hypothetical protein